jgi:hypothetical protein
MSSDAFLSLLLTSGGDRRIAVPRGGNTNVYGASPYPRSILGYASSTANDISLAAFRHLSDRLSQCPADSLVDGARYAAALETFRTRLRDAWRLPDDTAIIFAPSGTDLEYVALALAGSAAGQAVTNVLLGQDEVGSGCALASEGRHFASETALAQRIGKGSPVEGFEDTELRCVPVRDASGKALSSRSVSEKLAEAAGQATRTGRHALLHAVHGSKTGLVLPEPVDLAGLRAAFGDGISIVVDACQARIEAARIREYLAGGAMVFLTGSKFMGGPPFSGFALVPARFRPGRPLPRGLSRIFRRGEWPVDWPGCDSLEHSANPGLQLRLEAALFELDRFMALPQERRERVCAAFGGAIRGLAKRLGVDIVAPALCSDALHHATLATLDLSGLPAMPDMTMAQRWCRVLAARGLRLGQPVRCVRRVDGEWAGTLRLSLSMPLIAEFAGIGPAALEARLGRDMGLIADVLEAAQRSTAA